MSTDHNRAMHAVLDSMGRAAKAGKAKRFVGKRAPEVDSPAISFGDATNPPSPVHDMVEALTPEEMDELAGPRNPAATKGW